MAAAGFFFFFFTDISLGQTEDFVYPGNGLQLERQVHGHAWTCLWSCLHILLIGSGTVDPGWNLLWLMQLVLSEQSFGLPLTVLVAWLSEGLSLGEDDSHYEVLERGDVEEASVLVVLNVVVVQLFGLIVLLREVGERGQVAGTITHRQQLTSHYKCILYITSIFYPYWIT